jgi:hypothetical protein
VPQDWIKLLCKQITKGVKNILNYKENKARLTIRDIGMRTKALVHIILSKGFMAVGATHSVSCVMLNLTSSLNILIIGMANKVKVSWYQAMETHRCVSCEVHTSSTYKKLKLSQ